MRNQPESREPLTGGLGVFLSSDHWRKVGKRGGMLQPTPKDSALWKALIQDFEQALHSPDGFLILGDRKSKSVPHVTPPSSSLQSLRRSMSRLSKKLSLFGLRLKGGDDGSLLLAEAS